MGTSMGLDTPRLHKHVQFLIYPTHVSIKCYHIQNSGNFLKITVLKQTISNREKKLSPLNICLVISFPNKQQGIHVSNTDQVEKTHEKLSPSPKEESKATNAVSVLFLTHRIQFLVKFNFST